jgi:hypothetical protein
MKSVLALFVLLSSLMVQAQIKGSQMPELHQSVIAEAVARSCGITRDLKVISHSEEIVRIDQGIQDVYYTTVLQGLRKLDQVFFDPYEVIVKSNLADTYDHQNKVWGVFNVDSVTCTAL